MGEVIYSDFDEEDNKALEREKPAETVERHQAFGTDQKKKEM